ncbi:thiol-disulfide oxidoreductase DCC family protein [Vibrio sp. LaRot3]|uniref:thiol-disulfide oxidoreductase DCC family protein n=1 Tax=Vibrio sp. LaRot3 TaxID=2998829 RepID=UPI0022CE14E1|nr:DUF393 domain-containing protein [Vibrio sp. LaRot3]MDA0149853.1 DUF393 domain-containing protein [Vibrio sp. LaRot3]
MSKLTLFYGGTCPLCAKEMQAIRQRDNANMIKTVDIYSDEFSAYPNIDPDEANRILHAVDGDGKLWLGLDAAYRAWDLLGRGWLYAPLRWSLIKPLADKLYLYFANNRYRISYWLTGTSRCGDQCRVKMNKRL